MQVRLNAPGECKRFARRERVGGVNVFMQKKIIKLNTFFNSRQIRVRNINAKC